MPKTKMTRTTWGLVVLLMVALGATAIHRSIASNHQQDHQHHQQAQKDKKDTQPIIADGATNPQAIPDLVAYEFLFNSVADGPGATEPERRRARIFADRIGLDYTNYSVLRLKANEFRAKLASLDAQAKELKNRNWPNPSVSVMAQLSNLQAQKEKLLRKQFKDFEKRLSASDKEKLDKRLLEIKSKVKMYEPLPVTKFKRISLQADLRRSSMKTKFYHRAVASMSNGIFKVTFSALFLLTLQGVVWGQSSYTDIWVSGDEVIAYGSMSGTYMMGSHIDSTSISLSGPSGYASSGGGTSATVYLSVGEGGTFNAYTSHDSYCPDSGTLYSGVASSSAQTTTQPQGPSQCTLCNNRRSDRRTLCYAAAATCEGGFFAAYLAALNQCENNTFCQENNPNYNPEECERCRDAALQVFLTQTAAACVPTLIGCLATLEDCTGQPTGVQGQTCQNN